ncbi:MAG: hypothetical protein ACXWLX_07165 [Rhizomicrobium sp.]
MAIGTDYPTPVMVNGFRCKNCTDVEYAKKHIDPAHPKSGPYGIDAKDDPTVKQGDTTSSGTGPSVTQLAKPTPPPGLGAQLDISA